MLVPAVLYKNEILKKFQEKLYTKEMFYYMGYVHCHELPDLTPKDNDYKYAIIDSNNELIGYFAYCIEWDDTVDKFGLMSLSDKKSYLLGKDVFDKMEELIANYRRVEWRMIGGNPVFNNYYELCKRHNGYAHRFHQVTKSEWGYLDEWIFEIINPNYWEKFSSVQVQNRREYD